MHFVNFPLILERGARHAKGCTVLGQQIPVSYSDISRIHIGNANKLPEQEY